MPNPVPAADTGLPSTPFARLTTDHLREIRDEMTFALDISARRPSTPAEVETRRYLRATARYAKHLLKQRTAQTEEAQA